ncbi:MAG TPA: alpha-amylase family glycosyl hydrolase [Gaiellaceae bacterium]|nr:alpha-amylase family glycosyl hydrolase [Gaiellaceae bacterium]
MTVATLEALGAIPLAEGGTRLRVWAPDARSVRVDGRALARGEGGVWEAELELPAGTDYLVELDGAEWPDPCSRCQPEGARGPSRVVDTSAFRWSDDGWPGLSLDELVLYELHVGAFSDEGTFDGVIPHLAGLRELGVTAIELMPVATFPGRRGWGYDGVYAYAPHPAYGGPEGLQRLVDAAHAVGLGVILDVVYNHLGPGSEAIAAFGPYLTGRHETFWGDAIDYSQRGAREWAIGNACMWVGDYHVDGLRLDATHAVFDDSPRHVLAELAERVREENPRALVISEMEPGDRRPIEEWGHDAQWSDGLHHQLHALLTGEREGYYEPYGSLQGLAEELRREPAERLVVYAQNHDQVGNRALGDRLPRGALRVAAGCVLFALQTPLLFMGQEYGEERPFRFFTDHDDPAAAQAARAGRRREFEGFSAFSGDGVPDPQDAATFERSKLDRSHPDEELRDLHRELLALRRELPREVEVEVDERTRTLTARRGAVELHADFANATVELRR